MEDEKKGNHKKVDDTFGIINAVLITVIISSAVAVGLFVPFLHAQATETERVSYTTDATQDGSLELGESKITQEGKDGARLVTKLSTYSLFDYLFNKDSISEDEVSSEITKEPIDEIVTNGTKKYQYMWCTNGGYVSYTNDQFKDPGIGFTHKSEDYCAKDGEGKMTKLADNAPTQQSNQKTASTGTGSSSASDDLKRIQSNKIGDTVDLRSPSIPSIQYQPAPYNPPTLIPYTPPTPRKITVSPTPKIPWCYANGVCY